MGDTIGFFPKEDDGFILDTNALLKAIGAVLSHGKERVVGYGSFVLIEAQRNYCVTRK